MARAITHTVNSTFRAGLVVAGVLAVAGCGSSASTTQGAAATGSSALSATSTMASAMASKTGSQAASASAMGAEQMAPGAYLSAEQYTAQMAQRAGTKVVYFFHAPWCPDCRATDASLTSEGVPAGLTVVKVDFDSATDLRKKYGVTQQHTFVQVSTDGAALGTWSGSRSGEEIKAKTV